MRRLSIGGLKDVVVGATFLGSGGGSGEDGIKLAEAANIIETQRT
jgi:DUF917 family protein